MANAARSNLAILRARARGQKYIPASAMANTLTDPAKLLLYIPKGQTWGANSQLQPQVLGSGGFDTNAPGLYELPPAQAPLGIVSQKGTANAIPGWIDGFSVVPVNLPEIRSGALTEAAAVQQIEVDLLSFGRIVWKGDEQILRTIYFGDAQRREFASIIQGATTTGGVGAGGVGSFQAACGAPGQPTYATPGYVWTGRSAADFYVQNFGPAITAPANTDVVFAIYIYGQFILNIDPLQQGTADTIRGGTDGPAAGNCESDGTAAIEQRNAQAAQAMARAASMLPREQGVTVKTCSR